MNSNSIPMRSTVLTAAISSLMMASAATRAQEQPPPAEVEATGTVQLEEVLVTATRAGETNVQDTPIAISAFTADRLEKSGASNIQSLVALTPSLQIAETSNYPQIYLRGVGTNIILGSADPSTTVHLDGVYMARPYGTYSQFLDTERIEVLRGPQGVLYGRNSAGGTINVITREPSDEFQAKAEVTLGNEQWARLSAMVTGPLADGVAGSLAGIYSKHDGRIENVFPGSEDFSSDDSQAVRGKLRVEAADWINFTLSGDYSKNDGITAPPSALIAVRSGFALPVNTDVLSDAYRVSIDWPAFNRLENSGVSLNATVNISDELSLQSITAYRENKSDSNIDTDGTELRLRESIVSESQHQFTQEILANYSNSRLKAVAGLFYLDEDVGTDGSINTVPINQRLLLRPDSASESYSVFGNVTFDITDRWSASAGVRYVNDEKTMNQDLSIVVLSTGVTAANIVFDDKVTADAWTPKFGVEYEINPDVMLYASASKGFKSGGLNASATRAGTGYDPETLWAYELGVKSDLFDDRLRINAAAFHYDYEDLQVQQIVAVPVPALVIANAASAKIDGVEVEWEASLARDFRIGGFANWLDGTYGDYTAIVDGRPAPATGEQMMQAPEWKFGLYADYRYELGSGGAIFAFSDAAWQDDIKLVPSFNTLPGGAVNPALEDALTQDAYTLVNARLGYEADGGSWRIAAFVRNAFDTEYVVAGDATPFPGYGGQPVCLALTASSSVFRSEQAAASDVPPRRR